MQTLSQYLDDVKSDYTHACVKTYKPRMLHRNRKLDRKLVRQISGDIDFVREYFKDDPYGTAILLSGRFSPDECHATGFIVDVTCTHRLCDTH